MNQEEIRNKLFELQDKKYQKFHSNLCPGTKGIIGVRLPILRNLANEIAKEDWRDYLNKAKNEYYEEIMLQGMVIGHIKTKTEEQIEEVYKRISDFIPKINNWAVCDSFCAGLKIAKQDLPRMWNFMLPYLQTDEEFKIRFVVVMMLDYYLTEDYIQLVLKELDKIQHDGYYVKMAVAWAISIAFIKQESSTMQYLQNNHLDSFTYQKALQKILESYRVEEETKNKIKQMKKEETKN